MKRVAIFVLVCIHEIDHKLRDIHWHRFLSDWRPFSYYFPINVKPKELGNIQHNYFIKILSIKNPQHTLIFTFLINYSFATEFVGIFTMTAQF